MTHHDITTKGKLLRVGRRIFAKRGLKRATVREICAEAGANMAAVSYHYGGKEKLYIAVLQDYMERCNSRYSRNELGPPPVHPEEKLRGYIHSLLLKTLSGTDEDDERLGRLLAHEFIDPSFCFGELFGELSMQSHNDLFEILTELLPSANELTVARCAASIIGQCLLYDFARASISRISRLLSLDANNAENAADFIMKFSVGGVAHIRSELET